MEMERLKNTFPKWKRILCESDNNVVNHLLYRYIFVGDDGDKKELEALIYRNSPVLSFVSDSSETFLHLLCYQCIPNINIAQRLIDFGINIDKQDKHGNTPLHTAIRKSENLFRHNNIVRVLLKNGANRDITNSNGLTPLQLALFKRNLDAAEEFLTEEDKLPNSRDVDRIERCRHLVKCLVRERNHCNIIGSNYSVLLHFALDENDEESFEFVVNNSKFNLNAVHDKCMLLNLVINRGTLGMIASLANAGADLNVNFFSSGATPLIEAIRSSRTEVANFLLDCGVSVNKTEDNVPLHCAIGMQNFEIVERLLKMGADVNALVQDRFPLLLACDNSVYSSRGLYHSYRHNSSLNVKIVEVLLDHGANIEAKSLLNRNALDQACKTGELDIVKLLLSRGAKIDQGEDSTLLHAVRGEDPAVVKFILDQGANVDYRCASEKMMQFPIIPGSLPRITPLECALKFIRTDSTCKKIVETLVEHFRLNLNNVLDSVRMETPLHIACKIRRDHYKWDPVVERPIKAETLQFLLWECNANVNAVDSKELVPLDNALLYCNQKYNEDDFFGFNQDLVTLIAFIAKMLEAGEYVIAKNKILLLEHEFANPIYQKCLNELSLMKENICKSRTFSFFNILSIDIDKLSRVLKNKDLVQVLNDGQYKKNFPIYAEYLEYRIRQATFRQPYVHLTINLFHKHVYKNISVENVLYILKFLHVYHLKNFAKACFVDV